MDALFSFGSRNGTIRSTFFLASVLVLINQPGFSQTQARYIADPDQRSLPRNENGGFNDDPVIGADLVRSFFGQFLGTNDRIITMTMGDLHLGQANFRALHGFYGFIDHVKAVRKLGKTVRVIDLGDTLNWNAHLMDKGFKDFSKDAIVKYLNTKFESELTKTDASLHDIMRDRFSAFISKLGVQLANNLPTSGTADRKVANQALKRAMRATISMVVAEAINEPGSINRDLYLNVTGNHDYDNIEEDRKAQDEWNEARDEFFNKELIPNIVRDQREEIIETMMANLAADNTHADPIEPVERTMDLLDVALRELSNPKVDKDSKKREIVALFETLTSISKVVRDKSIDYLEKSRDKLGSYPQATGNSDPQAYREVVRSIEQYGKVITMAPEEGVVVCVNPDSKNPKTLEVLTIDEAKRMSASGELGKLVLNGFVFAHISHYGKTSGEFVDYTTSIYWNAPKNQPKFDTLPSEITVILHGDTHATSRVEGLHRTCANVNTTNPLMIVIDNGSTGAPGQTRSRHDTFTFTMSTPSGTIYFVGIDSNVPSKISDFRNFKLLLLTPNETTTPIPLDWNKRQDREKIVKLAREISIRFSKPGKPLPPWLTSVSAKGASRGGGGSCVAAVRALTGH